jgi:hypothetical protein
MSNLPSAPDARQDSSTSPADHATTLRFLDFLFAGVSGGFVEFRYLASGKKQKAINAPIYLSLPLEEERVIAEVLSRSEGRMVAVGPAPRCRVPGRGGAGKDHDVLQVICIWAHIEHRHAGGVIEVLRRIRDFPLRPSIVVNTGFAHQVYIVFHEPLSDDRLLEWSDLMLGLSVALSAGMPPTISQIIQLPETANSQEAYPSPCSISEESSSWMRYGVGDITAALHAASDKISLASSIESEQSSPAFSLKQLRQRGLSVEVIESILTGRGLPLHVSGTPPSGDESGPDFRLAYVLFKKGFAENEIKAIFRAHPHGCGRKWDHKRDGEKYLNLLLDKATTMSDELKKVSPSGIQTNHPSALGDSNLPPGYLEHEDGSVWFHPSVTDEGRKPPSPFKVCTSTLHITEIQEHIDTGQISVVITFQYLSRKVSISIPRARMADARQLVASLSGVGAPITTINARHITAYLAAYEHSFASTLPRKKVTSRFGRGRADRLFFFPGTVPGVEFAPVGPGDAALFRAYASRCGSLHGWLEAMRAIAVEGLIIPQVAVLTALIPPLQHRLQIPNFILDLHGNTSTGKSTALRLAASVYGRPADPDSLVLQWMNTSAAVEQVATTCNELPIFLDDAQHCPTELKRSVIYMIANGRGKGRGAPGGRGGLSETPTWHTVALSTSEEPLHEASPHEGARGRILSVGGLVPPFRLGMASFVQTVERIVSDNHGHAGETYIRHLNMWTATDTARWHRRYVEIRAEMVRGCSSDLMGRVSGYVAAVQLAAELAGPLLGLTFQPDVVGAWLALHVDEQQQDRNMVFLALRALADYYIANKARFAVAGTFAPQKGGNLLGSAREDFYVGFLRSTVETVFRARNWNLTALLNKMMAAGVLLTTENERYTKKVCVQGVQHRMICVKWASLLH